MSEPGELSVEQQAQAEAQLEALRPTMGDAWVERALAELRSRAVPAPPPSAGVDTRGGEFIGHDTNVQGDAVRGDKVVGDKFAGDKAQAQVVILAKDGAQVFVGEQPIPMSAVDRQSALGRYLAHVIAHNRYLQLQGIRSGGRLVNIELDQIYITLRATARATRQAEQDWLAEEAALAPGESARRDRGGSGTGGSQTRPYPADATVRVEQALAAHRRLVILGDPGSGKTTLLRYLALLYARDLAEGSCLVRENLGLEECGSLPVLLALRQVGAFLSSLPDNGTQGHAALLDFLLQTMKNARLPLPADFFDEYLESGRAVLLLDGLDEVADPDLRRRSARLVEAFALANPRCRFVITSRIVGYTGAARLGGDFAVATVQDFSLEDIRRFLRQWHRLLAATQMDAGPDAEIYAEKQTQTLVAAIQANERIRELAINPLLLTVIALVHRDRVRLPDRRAELYSEAVDVLLGKWDEAKGVQEISVLDGEPFDAGDKRLALQSVALHMHEAQQKEIATEDLHHVLSEQFVSLLSERRSVRRAVERFLQVIEERSGLLAERGEGVYAFSHLTFQEYLVALAMAGREDYVKYTLQRSGLPWWREAILLEAGCLSMLSRERVTRLVRAIADHPKEPVPYHNLVLASECLRDVGGNRVDAGLESYVQKQLRRELETSTASADWIERRGAAVQALARAGGGYWHEPYGEPEWVDVPAGEFWMGSDNITDDEKPLHSVYLPAYRIARTPVSNAQYALFVKAAGYHAPRNWEEGRPPKGKEAHPVVYVSWEDALAYCAWLGRVTGKPITLPSEAEWEKAACGDKDRHEYPWGDVFDKTRCNSRESSIGGTTPVGIFLEGTSPYGALDMVGNVWEWTRSVYKNYPYNPSDGREDVQADGPRVQRGGAFDNDVGSARCAFRDRDFPYLHFRNVGFRAGVSLLPMDSGASGALGL